MELNERTGKILLFTVLALRSTSLLFSTLGLEAMGPFTLLGYRFLLAFAVLVVMFWKRLKTIDRSVLIHGTVMGILFFLTMTCETFGLKMTNSSTTAFLENTAVVLVPIADGLLVRRFPGKSVIISSLFALAGVGFITLKGGHLEFSTGVMLDLLAAVFYTSVVITTDRYSKTDDAPILGVIQIGVIGILSMVFAFVTEDPIRSFSTNVWIMVACLALICTCLGFTLQPVAQKHVSATIAGLYCACYPLITAILGAIFLGERIGWNGVIGGAMIIGAMIAASLPGKPMKKEC